MIVHPIPPFYNENSKVLILGSFPSVKSREEGFFYAHPQNRFWRVLAQITGFELPKNIEEKKLLLALNGIALWDVIKSCEITGSSDASICNAQVNDIQKIVKNSQIKGIFLNGKTAEKYFNRLVKNVGVIAKTLPSTSPANARCGLDELVLKWQIIKEYLD